MDEMSTNNYLPFKSCDHTTNLAEQLETDCRATAAPL